jgi:NADPH:quinone reductase-like Zn-dependent oxidoreductase
LRPDEVLLEVASCGVGNWDEIARTGGWDLGRDPPMALGVEAAGTISVTASAPFPLEHAARALAYLRRGTNGLAVVLQPGLTDS